MVLQYFGVGSKFLLDVLVKKTPSEESEYDSWIFEIVKISFSLIFSQNRLRIDAGSVGGS